MPSDPLPDQRSPSPESKRLDIQGLRAVAVILVVAFHAGLPMQGGFIGVDVFLVISGFVIMGMLLRELQRTGTIRFRRFYARRAKRLLPALAVLTTVVVAFSISFGSSFGSQQATAKTGLGATYFSANLVIYQDAVGYFTPEAETNPLLHTWTLSVEEQVYLIFPSLLLGSWLFGGWLRRRTVGDKDAEASDGSRLHRGALRASQRSASVLLAVVVVASFTLSLAISFGWLSLPSAFAFFHSVTRVWEFAIGAGLALAVPHLKKVPWRVAAGLGFAGAAAILIGAFVINGRMPYPGVAVLVPVFGAVALIVAGSHPRAPGIPRLLRERPMARIGDLSYSWYLWHWPLIVFAASVWSPSVAVTAGVALASLIPAWISTTFIENPIRYSEAIRGARVVALAAVCTVIPTLACLGLFIGAQNAWGNEQVAEMQRQVVDRHAAKERNCDDAATQGSSLNDAGCEWNKGGKGPHVYLVGNSVAAMYSEALIGASGNLDLPLTIDTASGCFLGNDDNVECMESFNSTMRQLTKRPPGIVVISATWDLGAYGGEGGLTKHEKVNVLLDAMTAALEGLRGAGHQVLIVLPTPRFFHADEEGRYAAVPDSADTRNEGHSSTWRPSDCPTVVAEANPADCGATVPRGEVKEAQAKTIATLLKIAETTGSYTLDLRDRYCWDGVCRTNDGDRWMFEDGIHITVTESRALIPTFATALRDIMRDHWELAMPGRPPRPLASPDPASPQPAASPDPSPAPSAAAG